MDFPVPLVSFESPGNDPQEGAGLFVAKAGNAPELEAQLNTYLDSIAAEGEESVVVGLSLGGVGNGQRFVAALTVQDGVNAPNLEVQVPIGPADLANPQELRLGARVFCVETTDDANGIAKGASDRAEAILSGLNALGRSAEVYRVLCVGAGASQQQITAFLYGVFTQGAVAAPDADPPVDEPEPEPDPV